MTIDIIELAKNSPLSDHLWFNEPDEREAIEHFAALYKQALIDSGELVPAEKVKADAVDAARYRWLRGGTLAKCNFDTIERPTIGNRTLDAAIDRARSAL